jgi:hypothetical protein
MKKDKEELKKFKNPRDLSSEEYENLTLELKCCFFLKPWNESAEINTIEDWVNLFYVDYLPEDDSTWVNKITENYITHCKNLGRNEVNSLIAFTRKMICEYLYEIGKKSKEI